MQIQLAKRPGATKTMCLKPLTSLRIPNSRLTLTCKCSFLVIEKNKSFLKNIWINVYNLHLMVTVFQIPINLDFKILYGLFYSSITLNIHY